MSCVVPFLNVGLIKPVRQFVSELLTSFKRLVHKSHMCHGLSLLRIYLATTSLTSLLASQPVSPSPERARDQCQSAPVTLPINLSRSRLISRYVIDFITTDS